ncbi:MAG: hypothetical protein U0791_06815 [Gemmataceae bacterium]
MNQPFSSAAREFPTELLDHWRELDDAVSKRLLKQVLGATRHILDRWYYRAPPPPGSDVPSSWDYLLAKLVEGEFQSNVTELPGVVTSYPVQDRNNRASVLLYAVLNRPPHSVLDRFLSDPLTEGEGGLYGEHHALPKGLEEAVVFYGLNHFLTVQMPRQVPPELPGDFSRTVCKN